MRRWLPTLLLLATSDARAQGTLNAADVAARVRTVYAAVNTLEGDFEQQLANKPFGQTTTRRGHFRFAAPSMMRWDYTQPAGDVVVTDGTTLYAYDAASNVAYKMAPRKSQMPATLAFAAADLAQPFHLALMALPNTNGPVLKATPKVPTSTFNFALFYVSPAFEVRRVLIIDANDGRNRFDILEPVANAPIAPTTFQWTPPPGTKVITL